MTNEIIHYTEAQREQFIQQLKDMMEKGGNSWQTRLTNDARLPTPKYDALRKFIDDETPLLQDKHYLITTKVYWIMNGLTDFPRCKQCGKQIKKDIRVQADGHKGYADFCCRKCANESERSIELHRLSSIQKYGVDNVSKSPEIKKKIQESHFIRFGGVWNTQTPQFLQQFCHNNRSKLEEQVYEFISGITCKSIKIFQSDRTQMTPNSRNGWKSNHELDIWIPDLKLAVEFEGDYWHNPLLFPKTAYNDNEKQIQCNEKGITLVKVFETDWKTRRELIEKQIKGLIDEKQSNR